MLLINCFPLCQCKMPFKYTRINLAASHRDAVNALAFSPDGKHLASASSDTHIKLWELASGGLLHDISYSEPVLSVTWTSRKQIVAGTGNGKLIIVTFDDVRTNICTSLLALLSSSIDQLDLHFM